MWENTEMKFGIYDTKDKSWIGDESGPKLFDDELLAKVGRQVIACQLTGSDLTCVQMGWEVRPFNEGSLRKKSEQPLKFTGVEALTRIEEGRC